jgi:hypothetical protein
MPSSCVQRVEFGSNLEELAEAYVRYVLSTEAGRSMRRHGIAMTGVACTVLAFALVMMDPANRQASVVMPAAVLALLSGGLASFLYAISYPWSARRRLRRFLAIQFGTGIFACEIELRDEGVWARQELVEVTFHWGDLISAEDTDEGVEICFRGGYVLARSRAFATSLDRQNFLDDALMLGARAQLDARAAARASHRDPAPPTNPAAAPVTTAVG